MESKNIDTLRQRIYDEAAEAADAFYSGDTVTFFTDSVPRKIIRDLEARKYLSPAEIATIESSARMNVLLGRA